MSWQVVDGIAGRLYIVRRHPKMAAQRQRVAVVDSVSGCANIAQLMASSNELLAALKMLVLAVEHDRNTADALRFADTAIKAANEITYEPNRKTEAK